MTTFTALAQDYHTLRENEVMNVSDMDLNTGANAQIANEAYIEQHENMYYGDHTLITSDNFAAYLAAIQLIFGNEGFRTYALDIAEAAEFFEHAPNRVPAFDGVFVDSPGKKGFLTQVNYGAGAKTAYGVKPDDPSVGVGYGYAYGGSDKAGYGSSFIDTPAGYGTSFGDLRNKAGYGYSDAGYSAPSRTNYGYGSPNITGYAATDPPRPASPIPSPRTPSSPRERRFGYRNKLVEYLEYHHSHLLPQGRELTHDDVRHALNALTEQQFLRLSTELLGIERGHNRLQETALLLRGLDLSPSTGTQTPRFETVPGTPTPSIAPRGGSLADRVGELRPGYVLDVSDMDDAGKGARQKLAPKTERSNKFGIPGIPVISSNSRNYILALEMIYGAQASQQYAAEIAAIRAAHPGW